MSKQCKKRWRDELKELNLENCCSNRRISTIYKCKRMRCFRISLLKKKDKKLRRSNTIEDLIKLVIRMAKLMMKMKKSLMTLFKLIMKKKIKTWKSLLHQKFSNSLRIVSRIVNLVNHLRLSCRMTKGSFRILLTEVMQLNWNQII